LPANGEVLGPRVGVRLRGVSARFMPSPRRRGRILVASFPALCVPRLVTVWPEVAELAALVDALRIGDARTREAAARHLRERRLGQPRAVTVLRRRPCADVFAGVVPRPRESASRRRVLCSPKVGTVWEPMMSHRGTDWVYDRRHTT